MTIPTSTARNEYTASGIVGPYPVSFRFFEDSDLLVTVADAYGVETVKTLDSDYSVSGAGEQSGGSITFYSVVPSGYTISIEPKAILTQTTDIKNEGGNLREVIEDRFDRLCRDDQVQQNLIDRSIKIKKTDVSSVSLELPSPESGRLLRWNEAGTALVNGSGATDSASDVSVVATGTPEARWLSDRLAERVSVKDYGAFGDGYHDDTEAIQAALDGNPYKVVWFPYGQYKVSQITISGLGRHIDFDRAIIVGNATSAKTSIVQIKCGLSYIRNLKVAGIQNTNYECGVHWYTNNLNAYYPGKNRIDGLCLSECVIGLVIGARPNQADPIPAQGVIVADGDATDAPLSESYIFGMETFDCVTGMYCRQPNGKVCLVAPNLTGEDNSWASFSPRSSTCAFTLAAPNGIELVILGGDVEQIQQSDGLLFQVGGGTVHMIGTCVEAVAPIYMGGNAIVRMHDITNFGNNNVSRPIFEIDDGAEGILQLRDMRLVQQDSAPQVVVNTTSSLGGSFSPAPKFRVEMDGVEFYNAPFVWPLPIVNGAYCAMRSCSVSSYTAGVRNSLKHIDETDNLLAAAIDTTNSQITAYPQASTTSSGGWSFVPGGPGSTWGSYTSGLPTIEAEPVIAALRLTTTIAAMPATSAVFAIPRKKDLVFKCWAKSGTTTNAVLARVLWYKFDGTTAASTAQSDIFYGQESSTIGAVWRPIQSRVSPPADAAKAAIFLYAETGSDIQIANISLS